MQNAARLDAGAQVHAPRPTDAQPAPRQAGRAAHRKPRRTSHAAHRGRDRHLGSAAGRSVSSSPISAATSACSCSHPLWRELQDAIVSEGGAYARLVLEIIDRGSWLIGNPLPANALTASPAPAGTGPP